MIKCKDTLDKTKVTLDKTRYALDKTKDALDKTKDALDKIKDALDKTRDAQIGRLYRLFFNGFVFSEFLCSDTEFFILLFAQSPYQWFLKEFVDVDPFSFACYPCG
jgi:hypothetical protein